MGHSPEIIWLLSAGHSRRRTSGGKAEPNVAYDLPGKAIGIVEIAVCFTV
jgi:hypothetical protein